MSSPDRIGRNAPCPCGSGKKHKACCAQLQPAKVEPPSYRGWSGIVAAGVVLAAGLAVASQFGGSEPEGQAGPAPLPAPAPRSAPGALTPQPPGEAPPGKVWSPEHAHWHDAPGAGAPPANPLANANSPGGSTPAPAPLTPQPPGEAPPGKVWSPEHGHWHDAAAVTPGSQ